MAPAASATPRPSNASRRCPDRSANTPLSTRRVWLALESPLMRLRWVLTTVNVTAMGASTIRKTQRQDHVEVSQPAIGGPIIEGSTNAADNQLKTFGRNASG